jgi:hypothetical protein
MCSISGPLRWLRSFVCGYQFSSYHFCCMRMSPVFALASLVIPSAAGKVGDDWSEMRINPKLVILGTIMDAQ